MQQQCKKCGYESPEADRFCRQCGGQLSTESELSPTMTFNQAKVDQNPPVGVGTGRSVGDTIAGDTERYYSAPQYVPAQANIERYPSFAPLKPASFSWLKSFSRFMKGMFLFLLVAALVVTTGMAVFFSQEANHQRRRNWELEERARTRAGGEQANGRAQNAWERMEEALQLSHEAAEKATSAGATLMIGDEKPIDLDKYAYPGAQVEAKIISPGKEALSLLTHQNFDAIQSYYERQFGKPVLQVAVHAMGRDRKKLLFQSSTLPTILVKIEEEESNRGRVKITILHSFLRFPKFNEVQAQNLK
jgi:hypothetical protein